MAGAISQRQYWTGPWGPVRYATCPAFEEFIERLFDGDTELIEFTQTALGLALVGEQLEKVLIIFHGRGDTGKSVLLKIMEHVFGSYATAVSPSLLMEHRNEPHPERIARLKGVRLITTSELSPKKRFDNEEAKRLTGGDTLTGRFISSDSFNFKPAFTLFMAANDLPMFNGADKAMRERLRLVPVGTPIPKAQQDPALIQKLEQEASGILNWLLEGLARYRELGLVTPERIRAATDEYADDHDRVGRFFQEWIVDQPGAEATAEEIYLKYVEWCFEEGYQALGKPGLGKEIARMGQYESLRVRRGNKQIRAWRNIRIRRSEEHVTFLDATMPDIDPHSLNSFLPRNPGNATPLGREKGARSSIRARREKALAAALDRLPHIEAVQANGVGSLSGIARALNEQAIPAPRGGKWQAVQVKRILRYSNK